MEFLQDLLGRALGMSYFMNRVEAILDTPGPIDADSIDFFQFPNSPDSEE